MARVYATTTQLIGYTGVAAPDGAEALLAKASRFLDSTVFRLCWYHVGDDGMPSDAVVAEAFANATCAQVAWWDELGDSTGAAAAGWDTVGIGSVRLQRRSPTAVGGESSAAREIAPEVFDILESPDMNHHRFTMGGVMTW